MGKHHADRPGQHHGAPEAHHTAHQVAIHKATLRNQLAMVSDPDHPGQTISVVELEQRQRGRIYRQQAERSAAVVDPLPASSSSPTNTP
jgi:hypothetical protein